MIKEWVSEYGLLINQGKIEYTAMKSRIKLRREMIKFELSYVESSARV